MTTRIQAIGLTGRAQHGKDTVGQALVEYGATRVSFADKLKELALAVNPIIRTHQFPKHPERLQPIVELQGWEKAKTHEEVRRFLQELGTHARDILGPDVWVDAVRQHAADIIATGGAVVFTDVRFPNEARLVRVLGGMLVLVKRPNFDNGVDPSHPSEAFVEELGHDVTVVNDGTLEELGERAVDAIRYAEVNSIRG